MIEHELEQVEDVYNPLKGKLPQIIEYFVKFYGEEYREQIENRFNNTIFVFADREANDSIGVYFRSLKNDVAVNFEADIEELLGYEVINDVIGQGDYLLELMPKIKKWKDDVRSADKDELYSLLTIIKVDGVRFYNMEEFETLLKNDEIVQDISILFNNMDRLYEQEYKADLEYLDGEEKRIKKVGLEEEYEKIDKDFYAACQEEISVKLIKELEIEMTEENLKALNDMTAALVDYLLKDKRFLTPYDRTILNQNKLALYEMSGLEKEKIEGLSEEQVVWKTTALTRDVINSLREPIQELYDKRNITISEIGGGVTRAQEFIREDIVDSAYCLKAIKNFINNGINNGRKTGGIDLTTASKSNPRQVKNIICIDSFLALYDDVLIHEMNHAATSSGRYYVPHLLIKSGFVYDDQLVSDGNSENIISLYGTAQRYRALNEVINEYLNVKICELMQKDGFKIGINGDSGSKSTYRVAFPLLQKFFDEHLDDIIKCAMSEDTELMYEVFGKYNLDRLANAATRVLLLDSQKDSEYKYFMQEIEYMEGKDVDIFSLAKDKNREWSSFTEEYLACFARVEEVLEDIKAYQSGTELE